MQYHSLNSVALAINLGLLVDSYVSLKHISLIMQALSLTYIQKPIFSHYLTLFTRDQASFSPGQLEETLHWSPG